MGFSLPRPPFQMLRCGKQSRMWVVRNESAHSNKNILNKIWKTFCLWSESSGKVELKKEISWSQEKNFGAILFQEKAIIVSREHGRGGVADFKGESLGQLWFSQTTFKPREYWGPQRPLHKISVHISGFSIYQWVWLFGPCDLSMISEVTRAEWTEPWAWPDGSSSQAPKKPATDGQVNHSLE